MPWDDDVEREHREPPGRLRLWRRAVGSARRLRTAEQERTGCRRTRGTRAGAPRGHGDWTPEPDRQDPVALLEEQGASRVQELVPIRYGRMLVSPFTFYRGAAYLMASDLAVSPHTGLTVQLCGDAHLSNFGSFAAPDRRLVFGLNDFDETLPGPFEWDVKRLVASFAVAGRDRGFDTTQRESVNLAAARAYRRGDAGPGAEEEAGRLVRPVGRGRDPGRCSRAQMKPGQVEALREECGQGPGKGQHEGVPQAGPSGRRASQAHRRSAVDRPAGRPAPGSQRHQFEGALRALLHSYRRSLQGDHRHLLEGFHFVDAARKVVGVGSVGTRAWIVFMVGNDADDPLFLQAKEAQASVLEPFLGKSKHANHGQRVVEGQRLMQSTSDVMLGWIRTDGLDGVTRDFYVRQLWDGKGSAIVEAMKPNAMTAYARALRLDAGTRPRTVR